MGAVRTRYFAPTIPICTLHWTLTYLGTSMYRSAHVHVWICICIPWRGQTLHITAYDTMSRSETKTKLLILDFYFDCHNKINDPIVGSLVRDGSRILMRFIVWVKSYMEVSTSDMQSDLQMTSRSSYIICIIDILVTQLHSSTWCETKICGNDQT